MHLENTGFSETAGCATAAVLLAQQPQPQPAAPLPAAPPEPAAPRDRAAINRENARRSTGPRTPEGKQAVRLNAIKHGAYAQTVLLPTENSEAYQALGERLCQEYQPHNDRERELIRTVQNTTWAVERAFAVENNLFALATDQQLDAIDDRFGELHEDVRQALAQAAAFQANSRGFDQLSRAQSRSQSRLDSARRELDSLRASRPPAAKPAPAPAANPVPSAPGFVPSNSGFVPSNSGFVPSPAASIPPALAPVPVPTPAAAPAPQPRMPKFSGPQAKQHRKQWLRAQARKNAAA